MIAHNIAIVSHDDWEGLYIEGKLVFENHSIDVDQFCEYAGIEYKQFWVDPVWMRDRFDLPEKLEDCKFEEAEIG